MSALTLTKNYGDLTLLMASDLHGMWTELETKTNGNLDSDNVASGWASFSQLTMSKDTVYSMGATDSGTIFFKSSTNEFVIGHTAAKSYFVNIGGSQRFNCDTAGGIGANYDVYFYNRSTTYPLSYLIQYQKPVLVYVDSSTINIEQNTTTANRTLIVFPAGPIAVTEDVSSTHKFRQLKLTATANGYSAAHTGAADSGKYAGLTLADNTWYFVYAVVVQGGNDAGNNFILVVDDTSPKTSNWSTLDTQFGSGMWVYVGMIRIGHGLADESTLVPFQYDHQGWLTFTGRATSDDFFGIKIANSSITSTTVGTVVSVTAADSGHAAPDTCSLMKISYRPKGSGDNWNGTFYVTDSSDNVLMDLPSFGPNLATTDAHGFSFKVPNIGWKLKAETGA